MSNQTPDLTALREEVAHNNSRKRVNGIYANDDLLALLDRIEALEREKRVFHKLAHVRRVAIQRVRELHREVPYWTKPNRPSHVPEYACYHCIDLGDGVVAYPCPTMRALDGA